MSPIVAGSFLKNKTVDFTRRITALKNIITQQATIWKKAKFFNPLCGSAVQTSYKNSYSLLHREDIARLSRTFAMYTASVHMIDLTTKKRKQWQIYPYIKLLRSPITEYF